MKRTLALVLALVMLMACLTGCSTKGEQTSPAAEASTENTTNETNASESTAGEVTNIVVLQRGGENQTGEADVIAALNAYSAEKIGVTITFKALAAAEYPEALSRMIAAKDDLDVCFCASYTGFAELVAKGGLMDITDYIHSDTYKDLYNTMPETIWEAASVDGRNYCVTNYKETPFISTIVTPVALADTIKEKYGIDFNTIELGSYRDLPALEPYLQACKDEGVKYPALTNEVDMFLGALLMSDTEYELIGTDRFMPYDMNKQTHKVSNLFANPDFTDWFETMTRWNELGFWTEDNIPMDWNPRDQWPLDTWGIYPQNGIPDNAAQQSVSMGQPVYSLDIGEPTISASGALGSSWCITSYSPKAEAAMKWINLIETDKTYADMMVYGVEGVNYTRDSEDVVTKIPDSGWSMGRWKSCNFEIASITSEDSPDLKQKYRDFNNAGVLAELASFSPDYTNMESEMAAVKAVLTEVYHLYTLGFMTTADLPDTVARFEAAGDATMIRELQKQIDAYFAG